MKKQLLTVALLLSVLFVHSQTFTTPAYAEINDNYRNHVNNVFGILE
jgi:hypothetical protein